MIQNIHASKAGHRYKFVEIRMKDLLRAGIHFRTGYWRGEPDSQSEEPAAAPSPSRWRAAFSRAICWQRKIP